MDTFAFSCPFLFLCFRNIGMIKFLGELSISELLGDWWILRHRHLVLYGQGNVFWQLISNHSNYFILLANIWDLMINQI